MTTTLNPHQRPIAAGRIDNTALRAAFEASGLPASLIAVRLGWSYASVDGRRADGSRVKRALGVMDERGGKHDRARRRRTLSIETAGLLAEAIGVDPVAVGI